MPLYSPAPVDTGTIILDGVGPPDSALGAVDDYYTDVAGGDLYGPKIDVGAADYVEPPQDTANTGAYELGGKFRFDIDGVVTGVRYFFPFGYTPALGQTFSLWDMTGSALLATKAATLPTANAWNVVNFDTPVAVLANHSYLVSIWTAGVAYTYPASPPGAITSGHVRALAPGEDGNAAYYGTSAGFPTTPWASFPTLSPMFTLGAAWAKVVAGFDEAPEDANQYAREDAAWSEVAAGNDEAFGSSWNGQLDMPTRNAVYDRFESSAMVSGVQVSQPSGSPWLPTNAILESYPRFQCSTTGQTVLTSGTIRVFPIGLLRNGHTATGLGFVAAVAAAGITNSWVGICTVDRVVRAVSATSTAATNSNTGRTFTFAASYTPTVDTYVFGFIMYQATTVPSMYGVTQTVQVAPVVNGNSDASQTTPPAVDATLGTLVSQPTLAYIWLTGTT